MSTDIMECQKTEWSVNIHHGVSTDILCQQSVNSASTDRQYVYSDGKENTNFKKKDFVKKTKISMENIIFARKKKSCVQNFVMNFFLMKTFLFEKWVKKILCKTNL